MDNNYNNDQFNNDQQNVTPDYNQAPTGTPYNQAPMNDPYNGSMPTPEGPKGKAIASMVLGICAVVFGCCLWAWLGIVLGIIAIVLGALVLKNKEAGKGFAIAGLVCGIVGAVLGVAGVIITLIWGAAIKDFIKEINGALFVIK